MTISSIGSTNTSAPINTAAPGGNKAQAASSTNGMDQSPYLIVDSITGVMPSTIVNISEEGKLRRDWALAEISTPQYKAREAKYHALHVQEGMTYYTRPMDKSQEALDTMHIRLNALQKTIQTERPSLAGQSWDFVLKWDSTSKDAGPEDGKIEVTGVTNAQDKKWLEDKLNGDAKILKSVKDFYSAVVTFYEHTAAHPSQTVSHGDKIDGYAQNVAKQINNTLQVKALIDKSVSEGGTVASTGRPYFGDVLFDKVGRQLVSTTKATYASLNELAWEASKVTGDAQP